MSIHNEKIRLDESLVEDFKTEEKLSDEGIKLINTALFATLGETSDFTSWLPSDFDFSLDKSKGKLPKRIAKYVFKTYGLNITADCKSTIGNVANEYQVKSSYYSFDFTDDFSWTDGDFGDYGSCYWSTNSGAKEMIYDADGFAIRFYDEHKNGQGRAWVLPIDEKFMVVFNGYGCVGTREAALVLAEFLGSAYQVRKVSFTNNGGAYNMLYINSGVGYVVGPSRYDEQYVDLGLENQMGENLTPCAHCGTGLDTEWGEGYVYIEHLWDNPFVCDHCYGEHYFYCESCESECSLDDRAELTEAADNQLYGHVCEDCASNHEESLYECDNCNKYAMMDYDLVMVGDECYCEGCADKMDLTECEDCGQVCERDKMTEFGGDWYCEDCHQVEDESLTEVCDDCGLKVASITGGLCSACARNNHLGDFLGLAEVVRPTPTEPEKPAMLKMRASELPHYFPQNQVNRYCWSWGKWLYVRVDGFEGKHVKEFRKARLAGDLFFITFNDGDVTKVYSNEVLTIEVKNQ